MTILRTVVLAILLLLVLSACDSDPELPPKLSVFDDTGLTAIYDAAHREDTAALAMYATSKTAAYRMAYARLMGSAIPKKAPTELENLMLDPIPYVRLYAAFAVGQIGHESSLPTLEKAFKKATIPEIKAEFLEAIGKCADENAMEFLVTHNPNTAIEEAGKVWAIYRGMLKGQLKEKQLEIVVAHLASRENETRLAAANVLSRQRDYDLSEYAERIYQRAQKEMTREVKATLGYALKETDFAERYALGILEEEDDPLLRTMALAILPDPEEHVKILEDATISESPWVAMTAADRLINLPAFQPAASTISAARTTRIPEVAALVASVLMKAEDSRAESFYTHTRQRFNNPVKQGVLLGIWSTFPRGLDTLKNYLFIDGPIGTAAATAYLAGLKIHPSWGDHFVAFAERAFSEGLLSQSYLFALALRNPERKELISSETLLAALEQFRKPEHLEGYQAIATTLKENYGISKPPLAIDYQATDWNAVKALGQKPSLIVYINEEEYQINLVPEDAPSSVSKIARLAEAGFYDGTFFHRIVPAFVSQGGGPRGDGFGSDELTLRSEFSPLKYGTGVVGLASAGKDTESCQFFFTHLPTPHLDGRYTIIGASQNDVSTIETGALIDSVRVAPDRRGL